MPGSAQSSVSRSARTTTYPSRPARSAARHSGAVRPSGRDEYGIRISRV
ncbi:hypothetical protein [Actinomadura madurae]|nr:hypothetical protein [Actinomadura madurae]MCQ0017503.1 hypothetical protein [Actinomadura madurae]